jgi:hypothetical protein
MSEDINKWLQALRNENPSSADMAKWKAAVIAELVPTRTQNRRWVELAAAALIGLIIGAAIFKNKPVQDENLADGSATIEFVVTKSQ